MTKPVVLCTLPMHPAGDALLASAATIVVAPDTQADTFRRLVAQADYLLVRNHLPADLLDRPHHLQGIVRNGTGLDMIPVASATAQGVPVANVPGANAQAVAEYVVGSLMNIARRFTTMDIALHDSDWNQARGLSSGTFELSGKTIGIVGVGDIGKRVARICHDGLGMRVLAYQPHGGALPDYVESVSLGALLTESDFVTLHCPLTEETRHLLDATRLKTMKPSAFLVNAARGEVVDELALAQALNDGTIAGAAIDVYAEQPLHRDHPLLTARNAVLTPHVAALTEESSVKMSTGAARQILQLINGERPQYLVNPEVWEAYALKRSTATGSVS
jgi:D-3-phosphoglycerate dehydrogenase